MAAMDKMEEKGMQDPQEMRQHAVLSASASHRWLECTPSARAEENYPDQGSEFALEGTLAHAMASRELKTRLGRDTKKEDIEIAHLEDYCSGEMKEHTTDFADYVMMRLEEAGRATPMGRVKPDIRIEQRLDYSAWVPGGFGTGDAVIVSHDTVEVIDFKYGKGVKVEAENNPQMKLYALGAIDWYAYAYDIKKIRMTIFQPRIGNISSWETDIKSLLAWGRQELKPLAKIAWEGLGARKSGEWCRFCKAKGDCPRLTADCVVDYFINPNADTLTPREYSGILGMLPSIKDWIKTIEERSLALALDGTEIPGYKIVEGRSVRKIVDIERVAAALMETGATEEEVYRPRELRTLTDLEKTFGKKKFSQLCGDWIEKPAGKPTLAEVSDKRAEINKNDFNDLDI